jgi:hypothetical protein
MARMVTPEPHARASDPAALVEPPRPPPPLAVTSIPPDAFDTGALVREALAESKHLVQLEIELAKDEVRNELKSAKRTAIAGSAALTLALEGVALLLVALALALGLGPAPALILGVVLLALAGGAAYYAWRTLPRKPLDRTQKRLRTDAQLLKETVS